MEAGPDFAQPGIIGQFQPVHPAALSRLPGLPEWGHEASQGVKRYFLGFFVLAGVLSMMLALGLLIAWLSISVGRALSIAIRR